MTFDQVLQMIFENSENCARESWKGTSLEGWVVCKHINTNTRERQLHIIGPDNSHKPWLPENEDIFAEDWYLADY